jgi:endonuclease/exonuclease/phosphatase family metal-dependent hydrolase
VTCKVKGPAIDRRAFFIAPSFRRGSAVLIMAKLRMALASVIVLLAGACSQHQSEPGYAVTIMTFNVENLFDNSDDPGKDDQDYLPIQAKQSDEHREACARVEVESWRNRCLTIDWTDAIIERKLAVIADAILQVNEGRGPDIVALQEVENLGILERLRTEYLGDAGYLPGILIEGNDARGIDVAFLSRLPLNGVPQLHDIRFEESFRERGGDTRGILQADFFLPDGSLLTGFSVHFPAPYHPTEMRVAAYGTLNNLLADLPDDRHAFAAGDFNTTSAEDAATAMLDRYVRPNWTVSNDLCSGCKGSSYYAVDDTWSFLDMVLWRPCCGEDTTWQVRADSVRIANRTAAQVRTEGTPRRFSLPDGGGVSDHWPVVLTVESI